MIDLWTNTIPEEDRPEVFLLGRNVYIESLAGMGPVMTTEILDIITRSEGYLPVNKEDLVVAACDSLYAQKYIPEFVLSHAENDVPVHIHIDAMDLDTFFLMLRLYELVPEDLLTISYTLLENKRNTHRGSNRPLKTSWHAYYTCIRFFIAEKLLETNKSIVICDADFLLTHKYKYPDYDVSLAFNENFGDHNHTRSIWAGVMRIKNSVLGKIFLNLLCEKLEVKYQQINSYKWSTDQQCLYEVWKEIGGEIGNIFKGNQHFYMSINDGEMDARSPYFSPKRNHRWFTNTPWYGRIAEYRQLLYKV